MKEAFARRRAARRARRWIPGDLIVSVSLTTVALAAASALPRLFVESKYRPAILGAALVTCVFAAAFRALRLPTLAAPIVSGTLIGVVGSRFCFPDLVTSTNPLRLPFRAIGNAIALDWNQLSATKAPVLGKPGFALTAILGAWLITVLADILAFTLRSPLEALVPPTVLVIVGAIIATPGSRVVTATLLCATGAFHVCAVNVTAARRRPWSDGQAPSVLPQLAKIGAITAAVAAFAAIVVPATGLPTRAAVIDWRTESAKKLPNKVTSPMVSLKRQLLDLPNTVMFTASAVDTTTGLPVRTYWKLSTLTLFDGTNWTSNASYRPVERTATVAQPPNGSPDLAEQVTIASLRSSWIPVASQVQSVDLGALDDSISVGYDRRGGSVLLGKQTTEGLAYTALSTRATIEAGQDRRLADPGWEAGDVDLPSDFPRSVSRLAIQIAAEAPASDPSLFSAAENLSAAARKRLQTLVALQTFFRTQFVYSTEVPAPSTQGDLERFVQTDRAGYCEQFSGAFAAMARSLGIPSRVVVGFSPGAQGADGRFTITGKNSHAWPEAYIDGVGWLAFEPTPGRGIPGAEDYSGVADQDASEGLAPSDLAVPSTTLAPTVTPIAPTVVPPPTAGTGTSTTTRTVGTVLALGLLLLVVGLAGVALMRHRRRDPVERQWSRVLARLRRLGLRPEVDETERSFAQRASVALSPGAAAQLADLVARLEARRFGPSDEWTDADTAAFAQECGRFAAASRE